MNNWLVSLSPGLISLVSDMDNNLKEILVYVYFGSVVNNHSPLPLDPPPPPPLPPTTPPEKKKKKQKQVSLAFNQNWQIMAY